MAAKKESVLARFRKNKGLVQFSIRTIIFFAILFGVQLFLMFYFRYTSFFIKYLQLGEEFYFQFLTGLRKTDFINSMLFAFIIFLLWNRRTIAKLNPYKQDKKETILFGALAALTLVSHYIFKYWVNANKESALENLLAITLAKYGFNIAFVILLAFSIYNRKFFTDNFRKFRRQIPVFALLSAGYFFIIQMFQLAWSYLGTFVAKIIYFMLTLTVDNAYIRLNPGKSPIIGVGKFIVGISEECSGIDSLLLFLSLFTAILALDWYKINRKRMFMLLVPGIIFTVFYNILRVYLLILVGVYYDPQFAVDTFHTNIGWILFLVFFVIFWNFGSKWVYQKEKSSKK